jgi:hypothetical protein
MGRPRIKDKRICSNCGSDKTRMDEGIYPKWTKYNDAYLCARCANKILYIPRKTKEAIKKYNDINNFKMLRFKGKRILLKENPRKGVCSWCGAVKGIDCKLTNMHHIEYHDDNILKDTIEICASCHGKEHARIRRLNK